MPEPLSPVEAAIARLLRAAWVAEQRAKAARRGKMQLVDGGSEKRKGEAA